MRISAILIWTVLCVASGSALFSIAFAVEELEEELTVINSRIERERETLHVLAAEWSYLTRPERIEKLGAAHLPDLIGLTTDQMVTLADVPEPFVAPPAGTESETVAAAPSAPRAPRPRVVVPSPIPSPAPGRDKPSFETLVRESLLQARSAQ